MLLFCMVQTRPAHYADETFMLCTWKFVWLWLIIQRDILLIIHVSWIDICNTCIITLEKSHNLVQKSSVITVGITLPAEGALVLQG